MSSGLTLLGSRSGQADLLSACALSEALQRLPIGGVAMINIWAIMAIWM
jgi:hypothetical protein